MPERIQIVPFKPENTKEPFATRNTGFSRVDLFLPDDYEAWGDGGYQVNVESFGRSDPSFTLLHEKAPANTGLETFNHAHTFQEAAIEALRAVAGSAGRGGKVKQARASS